MIATKPTHVYEVYIRTTPERLWQAITDGADTARYYYGTAVSSSWRIRCADDLPLSRRTLAAEGDGPRGRSAAPAGDDLPRGLGRRRQRRSRRTG